MVEKARFVAIDILRGVAIFTMVAANMAGEILIEPHPFWFRCYGTWAAAIFIFLSGMMIALGNQKKAQPWGYVLKRSFLILIVASIIDLTYGLFPFVGVDVLYLIGIGLPCAFGYCKLRSKWRRLIIVGIILATPFLQKYLIYSLDPPAFVIGLDNPFTSTAFIFILRSWFIEGWFPIFPWLGFSLLGAEWGIYYFNSIHQYNFVRIMSISLGILGLGIICWLIYPGPLYTRSGYSELFYPPTIGYILTAIGLIFVLFALIDRFNSLKVLQIFRILGESSLFFYIFHQITTGLIIIFIGGQFTMGPFMVLYVLSLGFFLLIGIGLRKLKQKWPNRPYLVQFLIG